MKRIEDICNQVKNINRNIKIGIAGISGEEIRIIKEIAQYHFFEFVLVDRKDTIESLLKEHELSGNNIYIEPVENVSLAPRKVFELLKEGKIHLPMKGQVHTSTFLKAVLDKEIGIASGKRLSQITVFDGYNDSLQFLTDCAININPNLNEKIEILNNAVSVYQNFNKEEPKVALLGAVETVSEKMPDTLDSAIITQMNRRGQIKNCIVDGPLSLDGAISKELAEIKHITGPVAGNAQILLSSDLREANNLSKAIIHYAKKNAASIIAGTTRPLVMTSRSDSTQNKINTIFIASYMMLQLS
ncbi:phosphate acyltransferase [Otariodibacter sp.]|uniref:phosphate acyltransferase n=1 Tax=Otariodibacter sp. TaxID=3030919 RepID=UPI00261FCFBC|nr:phosphate acyltransferase [Otariodibacter sp.]